MNNLNNEEDAGLVETTMTCRLAQDSRLDDVSWVKPGKASWEWWNAAIPYGPDVNFRAGLNVETYKYFIDLSICIFYILKLFLKSMLPLLQWYLDPNKLYKQYKTYDGKKIDRVISSTLNLVTQLGMVSNSTSSINTIFFLSNEE